MGSSATKFSRDTLTEIRQRFAQNGRLGQGAQPIQMQIEPDGALLLEGEVDRVAQKKIVLELAAAHPSIHAIVDRLRVRPAERLTDAAIRNHLRDVFALDPSLSGLAITELGSAAQATAISRPEAAAGAFDYSVSDGVVTLNGTVKDLAIKRYIGVLAWWCPGSRDVINGIVATSDDSDGPDRIADAVRIVLEKDPYYDAAQIKVGVRQRVVRLTGWLPSVDQSRMAENDAWYLFGVDDVINEIETPE
ncbi:MAG: BON domain-containing protein [Rhodobacteraceae bacterium]|nr:BON domain-containing protein [Alphaproteobacteria bacterium]NNK65557.1 BON domain-containing protein [Paracoccaceae bacterium]